MYFYILLLTFSIGTARIWSPRMLVFPMELLDFILHVDQHLLEFVRDYGIWIYAILFLIIFCRNRSGRHALPTRR